MNACYQEIMELWKAGKFFDAISYFCHCISEGSVSQEGIKGFNKRLAEFWELVEVECEENAEVIFNLYEMLRKTRNWDDKALCRKLEITGKTIEDIKNCYKPRSEGVGLKMLYELFPEMAV